MAKHEPTTSWSLREHHGTYVRTISATKIELCVTDRDPDTEITYASDGIAVSMSRQTARLLIKRLTQMLEATR